MQQQPYESTLPVSIRSSDTLSHSYFAAVYTEHYFCGSDRCQQQVNWFIPKANIQQIWTKANINSYLFFFPFLYFFVYLLIWMRMLIKIWQTYRSVATLAIYGEDLDLQIC